MQVWFVSTQRAWGGGEVYLRHLAAGLREQNIDVRFAAPKHSPLAGQMASEGFPVFGFDGRGRNPRTLWQLRSRLRSTPQTIVHCNDSHALTLGGLASLGLANTKTIAMRHTMFPIRSPGKYHRLADRTICVSNAVAQQCVADGLQRNTLSVVHVGIPSPVVDPATVARLRQSVCGPDQRLIVAVGNLLECKGHAALIAAVDALQSPTNRLVLAIAGEGKHRDALERQIAGLRYPGAIRLLGFQTNPHEWLAAADLVAHPSLQEGLCLTVVAAMMLRRPVVASPVGGLCEVMQAANVGAAWKSELATLCRPADANDIARAIAVTSGTAPIAVEAAATLEAAYQHATASFSVDSMVQRTISLYGQLWQAPRAAA